MGSMLWGGKASKVHLSCGCRILERRSMRMPYCAALAVLSTPSGHTPLLFWPRLPVGRPRLGIRSRVHRAMHGAAVIFPAHPTHCLLFVPTLAGRPRPGIRSRVYRAHGAAVPRGGCCAGAGCAHKCGAGAAHRSAAAADAGEAQGGSGLV